MLPVVLSHCCRSGYYGANARRALDNTPIHQEIDNYGNPNTNNLTCFSEAFLLHDHGATSNADGCIGIIAASSGGLGGNGSALLHGYMCSMYGDGYAPLDDDGNPGNGNAYEDFVKTFSHRFDPATLWGKWTAYNLVENQTAERAARAWWSHTRFGDPELGVRTDEPREIGLTRDYTVASGTFEVSFGAFDDDSILPGVRVGVRDKTDEDDLYTTVTDATGAVTLSSPLSSSVSYSLTTSGWNTLPWSCEVLAHSGDTLTPFWEITLTELMRVIQFYNSTGYHTEVGTEDCYGAGADASNRDGYRHNADYQNPAWEVNLTEVNRFSAYYTAGGYVFAQGTDDGFAPAGQRNLDGVRLTVPATRMTAVREESGLIEVPVRIAKAGTGEVLALGLRERIPAGWKFSSLCKGDLPYNVKVCSDGTLEFFWLDMPSEWPVEFTYYVSPLTMEHEKELLVERQLCWHDAVNSRTETATTVKIPIAPAE